MLKIRVSTQDLRRVEQQLRRTKERLRDREVALRNIRQYLIQRWDTNFRTEGGIYGQWDALSFRTIIERLRSGFGTGPTLYRTGWLYSRFSTVNRSGRVNRASLAWDIGGGEDDLLLYHHFGSRNVRAYRDNPSRLLWDINQEDEDYAAKRLEDWVEAILVKEFGGT